MVDGHDVVPVEMVSVEYGRVGYAFFGVSFYEVDVIGIALFDEVGIRIIVHFELGNDLEVFLFVVIGVEDICGRDDFSDLVGVKVIDIVGIGSFDQVGVLVLVYGCWGYVFDVIPIEAIVEEYLGVGYVSFDSVYYQVYLVVVNSSN